MPKDMSSIPSKKKVFDFETGQTRVIRMDTTAEKADVKSYEVKIKSLFVTPVPIATGDDRINVLKHNFHENMNTDTDELKQEIEIAIRNIAPETIATIVFNAEIFDTEGSYLGEVRHIESDIKPNTSRAVIIQIDNINKYNSARSYKVSILKTITADTQKVLLRRDEKRVCPNGDINVSGVIKNVHTGKNRCRRSRYFSECKKRRAGHYGFTSKRYRAGHGKEFQSCLPSPSRRDCEDLYHRCRRNG
jgi:sporulation protein YlmC with PRC-barrel domain